MSLLAGACPLNKQSRETVGAVSAPQMARRLLLPPADREQGGVNWLALLIWCKQNKLADGDLNNSVAACDAFMLWSGPGGGLGGWHTTCGQTNIKGDSAALSSLLTCRPWSTLGAIHNNTQAGHYRRDTADDNKQTSQPQRSTGSYPPRPTLRSKVTNIRADSSDTSLKNRSFFSFCLWTQRASFPGHFLSELCFLFPKLKLPPYVPSDILHVYILVHLVQPVQQRDVEAAAWLCCYTSRAPLKHIIICTSLNINTDSQAVKHEPLMIKSAEWLSCLKATVRFDDFRSTENLITHLVPEQFHTQINQDRSRLEFTGKLQVITTLNS